MKILLFNESNVDYSVLETKYGFEHCDRSEVESVECYLKKIGSLNELRIFPSSNVILKEYEPRMGSFTLVENSSKLKKIEIISKLIEDNILIEM